MVCKKEAGQQAGGCSAARVRKQSPRRKPTLRPRIQRISHPDPPEALILLWCRLQNPKVALLFGSEVHTGSCTGPNKIQGHIPAPPKYTLRYPKYHLLETIRPLIEVHWGVQVMAIFCGEADFHSPNRRPLVWAPDPDHLFVHYRPCTKRDGHIPTFYLLLYVGGSRKVPQRTTARVWLPSSIHSIVAQNTGQDTLPHQTLPKPQPMLSCRNLVKQLCSEPSHRTLSLRTTQYIYTCICIPTHET